MPIIVIHRNDLSKDEFPAVLESYLSDTQWVVIRSTLLNVQRQAQGVTCLGELTACLCCGIWCVFCFHPCIYNLVLEQAWQGEPKKLNDAIFNGSPVISLVGQSVVFNTDLLPVTMGQLTHTPSHAITYPPTYATSTPLSHVIIHTPSPPPPVWGGHSGGYMAVGVMEEGSHIELKAMPASAPPRQF